MRYFCILSILGLLFIGCKTVEMQEDHSDPSVPLAEEKATGDAPDEIHDPGEIEELQDDIPIQNDQAAIEQNHEGLLIENIPVPILKIEKDQDPKKEKTQVPESDFVDQVTPDVLIADDAVSREHGVAVDTEASVDDQDTLVPESDQPAPLEMEEADTQIPESPEENLDLTDEVAALPSELHEVPFNPLINPPDSEPSEESPQDQSPDWPSTVPSPDGSMDKEEQLSLPPETNEPSEPASAVTESLLDGTLYVAGLDHLNRLVISLEGAGWIFLSARPSEGSTLKLLDKTYEPLSKTTVFVFRIEGEPDDQELVIMKQDLSSGESNRYILKIQKESMTPEEEGGSTFQSGETETAIQSSEEDQNMPPAEASLPPVVEADTNVTMENVIPEGTTNESATRGTDLDLLSVGELLKIAENYETAGPGQSLERAREYYLFILEKFPVSLERFQAEDRLRYLDRHYFKVQ